ncbi:MAG: hypothetical protein Q9M37_06560 [Desulfonauticus sp.]|nr:hypothetical protein [Desulfonauticus sp.]
MEAEYINKLIGEEFLTWLWFKSEMNNGLFTLEGKTFALYFSGRIVVEGGEGESLEKTICSGEMSDLAEAKQGLKLGKKVTQARLKVEQDNLSWQLNVKAEDFSFSSFKTPKVDLKLEKGETNEGLFLEKMYLLEKCLSFFFCLFKEFISIRFNASWDQEQSQIVTWLNKTD